jgi:hypothetical protein
MFRKSHITAWVATAALACATVSLSLAENHRRNDPPRPPQSRPHNQGNQSHPNNQSVPRPPQNNQSSPQGHHAGQWLRQYQGVPFDQQKKALQNDPNFRKLPAERQQKLQDRLQRFNSLPPERQQRVLNRMEIWEHLTPDQKAESRRVYSGIRALPPERRQAMQNAVNALRAMPPDARDRAIQSGRFSQYSPQEQEMLRGVSKLPLAPAETEQAPPQ